jgi:oligo-1,6-glucosidase
MGVVSVPSFFLFGFLGGGGVNCNANVCLCVSVTTGEPWMRVNENYKTINVADQERDEGSVLAFWKRMVALRKAEKGLFVFGTYHVRDWENEQTWTFEKRSEDGKTAWVVLNFSEREAEIDLPKRHGKFVLANMPTGAYAERLQPFEGRVYIGEGK